MIDANYRVYGHLAFWILVVLYSPAHSQVVRRGTVNWIGPHPDAIYRIDDYEVTESSCSIDRRGLCVFLQRDSDKKPILFYINQRQILVTLGHRRQLVLINDWEATKSGKVVVANLTSGTKKQIDKQSLSMYRRHVTLDRRLWIVPEAYQFSPDDNRVLIKMEKEDVSATTTAESIRASRTYKEWWYAVDSDSGRVLCEYRTNDFPKRWWLCRNDAHSPKKY